MPAPKLQFLLPLLLCSQQALPAQSSPVDCKPSVLSITDYQFVSQQPASGGQSYMTYSATLVNSGMALGFVHATLTSLNPFTIRVAPGQGVLSFAPVAADSRVIGGSSFTVLVNPAVPIDFSKLQWTFDSGAALPVAFPGPDQTVPVGTVVTLDGGGSLNPSCGQPLTYQWMFTSRPPGSITQLFFSSGPVATFLAGTPGVYVIQLLISNGVATSVVSSIITVIGLPPAPRQ